MLHLIGQWLDAPVREENGNILPNRQGVPQGGVISPLLADCTRIKTQRGKDPTGR
jgi:retron-type reverse transcriptase